MKPITREQQAKRRKQWAYMVKKGSTVYEVARDTGFSVAYVRTACGEHGISCRTIRRKGQFLEILASLLRDKGKSQSAIARDHGVTRQYVSHVHIEATNAGIFSATG